MCVCNPDRSPLRINQWDLAQTPTRLCWDCQSNCPAQRLFILPLKWLTTPLIPAFPGNERAWWSWPHWGRIAIQDWQWQWSCTYRYVTERGQCTSDALSLMPRFSAPAGPRNSAAGLSATLFPWSGAPGFPVRSATTLLAWSRRLICPPCLV